MRRVTVVSVVQQQGQTHGTGLQWEDVGTLAFVLAHLDTDSSVRRLEHIPTEVRGRKQCFISFPSNAQNELGPLDEEYSVRFPRVMSDDSSPICR